MSAPGERRHQEAAEPFSRLGRRDGGRSGGDGDASATSSRGSGAGADGSSRTRPCGVENAGSSSLEGLELSPTTLASAAWRRRAQHSSPPRAGPPWGWGQRRLLPGPGWDSAPRGTRGRRPLLPSPPCSRRCARGSCRSVPRSPRPAAGQAPAPLRSGLWFTPGSSRCCRSLGGAGCLPSTPGALPSTSNVCRFGPGRCFALNTEEAAAARTGCGAHSPSAAPSKALPVPRAPASRCPSLKAGTLQLLPPLLPPPLPPHPGEVARPGSAARPRPGRWRGAVRGAPRGRAWAERTDSWRRGRGVVRVGQFCSGTAASGRAGR